MSAPKALRQPASLRLVSAAFLAFWCLIAAFPIFWIAVMSIKVPIGIGPAPQGFGNHSKHRTSVELEIASVYNMQVHCHKIKPLAKFRWR